MAGRGTDIMLGGSVDFLADQELRKQGLDPVENIEEYEAAWPAMVERIKAQVAAEHDEVRELGGLYVVGTERHESRRIDNQLRGRSGRQGDPGESRFYLSLEDELMRLFKSDWVDWVLTTLKVPDDVPIENKRVTGAIASAQAQVESQNFDSRKNVLKYDDVMNRQREVIYGERRAVLEGADLHEQVRSMIDDVVSGYVTGRHRRASRRSGTSRRCGPRSSRSTRSRCGSTTSRRRPAAGDGLTASSWSRRSRRTPRRRTTRARRSSAPRSCASSSAASCCPCSTASGASTSTRWTTSARASACAPTRSATRWWSTSARASTCSPR